MKYYTWNGEIVVKRKGIAGVVSVDTKYYDEYYNGNSGQVRSWPGPDRKVLNPLNETDVLEYKLLGRIDMSILSTLKGKS